MKILWLIPILLILYIILLDRVSRKAYAYEKKSHRKSPANFEIDFDEVSIPVPQGGELYGWWIAGKPEMPSLVLIHGWSRNVQRMLPYIRHLHPLGYNLLAIDARNHGSSSSLVAPSVGTFTQDVLAAVDFLAEKNASTAIGLIGLSVGGGAVAAASGQDKRIQATVTVGAIGHPLELMKAHFEQRNLPGFFAASLFLYMRLRYGIDYEKIAPVNNISNADGQVLIIHGENDETVPLSHARMLASANPTHARLWEIPAKGHSDCHLHPDFWARVEAFFNESFQLKEIE